MYIHTFPLLGSCGMMRSSCLLPAAPGNIAFRLVCGEEKIVMTSVHMQHSIILHLKSDDKLFITIKTKVSYTGMKNWHYDAPFSIINLPWALGHKYMTS